jgi:protein-S-isoprenylcysteine O-methyltransferase Ste14
MMFLAPGLLVAKKLARKEERDMEEEFGEEYRRYKESTGMFLPSLKAAN